MSPDRLACCVEVSDLQSTGAITRSVERGFFASHGPFISLNFLSCLKDSSNLPVLPPHWEHSRRMHFQFSLLISGKSKLKYSLVVARSQLKQRFLPSWKRPWGSARGPGLEQHPGGTVCSDVQMQFLSVPRIQVRMYLRCCPDLKCSLSGPHTLRNNGTGTLSGFCLSLRFPVASDLCLDSSTEHASVKSCTQTQLSC